MSGREKKIASVCLCIHTKLCSSVIYCWQPAQKEERTGGKHLALYILARVCVRLCSVPSHVCSFMRCNLCTLWQMCVHLHVWFCAHQRQHQENRDVQQKLQRAAEGYSAVFFGRGGFSCIPVKANCFTHPSAGGQCVTMCAPLQPTALALAQGNRHGWKVWIYSPRTPALINSPTPPLSESKPLLWTPQTRFGDLFF